MCSMTRLGPILVLYQPWRLHLFNNFSGYLIPHTSDSTNHIPILWIIISPRDPVIGSCTVDDCRHNGLSESKPSFLHGICNLDSTKHRLCIRSVTCWLLGDPRHTPLLIDQNKLISKVTLYPTKYAGKLTKHLHTRHPIQYHEHPTSVDQKNKNKS